MNDDGSNLQPDLTADVNGARQGGHELRPDDPVFTLAVEVYDRLLDEVPPDDAFRRAIESTRDFLITHRLADEAAPGWGWVFDPVFDLPVGWSTPGAQAELAAAIAARFQGRIVPSVVDTESGRSVLACPVIGHDENGQTIAGAVIAVPLVPGAQPDDNVLVGVATGGGILGVQLENAMRAREARRALELAQAASRAQRILIDPTDLGSALEVAIRCLSECGILAWGTTSQLLEGVFIETNSFGQRRSELESPDGQPVAEIDVVIDGETEATIAIQSRHTLTVVERDTLESIASAIVGSVVRFRDTETIENLRRSATRRLVEAQERERSMVAADIHDGVLQQLGATAIRLELAQTRVEKQDYAVASEIIADGAKEIRSCARELRALLMELRPQVLDDNGLNAALSELGRHVEGVEVTVSSDVPDSLGNEFAITIFRIVQEALTNVEKHAQATLASVEVKMQNGAIMIDVTDNGVGYEGAVTGPSAEGSHLGLLGMRERAQMFGGTFSISGASGGGTEIHAMLPHNSGSQPD